jgi:hypothetical protein
MDISIFDAFPKAIISGIWQIGTCQHGTLIGNQFEKVADIDVIIDDGSSSDINTTPEALTSDLLVYVCPEQMPTTRTNVLVSDYMLYDSEEDNYYMIVDAGVGKNQHTGNIEHLELELVQTEVVDG